MPTNQTKMGEILHKRTHNSKTWLNFDGSYTTEIHGGTIHYEDEHGDLHNINTDLFDEADFDQVDEPVAKETENFINIKKEIQSLKKENQLNRDKWNYQAIKVPFDAKLPRNFRRGYSIGKGPDKLTFKPVDGSPAQGYTKGNCVEYQDVWNDADVCLEVQPNGLKETITLKTDRAPSSFSFEVTGIDSLTELKLQDAWLMDAEGVKRDVEQTIRHEGGKSYVDLTADVSGLVYPIAIDPTVTIQPDGTTGKDAYISTSGRDTNYNSTSLTVGEDGDVNKTLIQFDVSVLPDNVFIENAYIELFQYAHSANWSQFFSIYRITEDWDETTVTWNTEPGDNGISLSRTTLLTDGDGTWKRWDVDSAVQGFADGEYPNFGFKIEENGTDQGSDQYFFHSSEYTTSHPRMTIVYNESPTTPVLITANGGETWNAEHTIEWQSSTDPEGDSLTYQIQVSTDNGTNWNTIATGITGTTYTYDFSSVSETSTALLRIRAYDGTSYSEWDESDGVFTIEHNQAPLTPTGLNPAGGEPVDYLTTIRLSWEHNDPNSGDPQSKYDLQWRTVGASTWNTITNVSINNYYDAPGGTFPADSDIEWRVRTYDQEGLASPYSTTAKFYAGEKPTSPTVTYPNEDVPTANPTIQWSSSEQASYNLEIYQGTTLVYSYQGGTNKAHTVQYDLINNTMYELRLSITNAEALTSDESIVNFYVSYTPPATAQVTTTHDNDRGAINIEIENPDPTGTEPIVAHNDVYRKTDGTFIRIAQGLPTDITYTDYTPASEVTQEYFVRAWGDNGTFSDSPIVTDSVTVPDAQIALTSDYEQWVDVEYNTSSGGPDREFEHGVEQTLTQYAGRKNLVPEFGEHDSLGISLSFILQTQEQIEQIRQLAYSREILLYRDDRGRREFVILGPLSVTDIMKKWYKVEVSPVRVSYKEEV